jgi:antitoxin component HigA of HigAB toxin-antitoxin module
MKYPFKTKEEKIEKYLFELKEVCIIEHEDNWFKEKSHTKLYPNLDEAKSKVAKPYYWILNAIDNYENDDCENKELALAELAILVFKSNYYSQKLTSETENIEVKKVLVNFMSNCDLSIEFIADQIASKDVPKYARIEMDSKDVIKLISSWVN